MITIEFNYEQMIESAPAANEQSTEVPENRSTDNNPAETIVLAIAPAVIFAAFAYAVKTSPRKFFRDK